MSKSYDDIINLPRPVSKNRPQMPLIDRAAQFAPFAALSGHEDAVRETARLTREKPQLDEQMQEIINGKLQFLSEQLSACSHVSISYFKADMLKSGGEIAEVSGVVEEIKADEKTLYMQGGIKILFADIIDIKADIFPAFL